jgi:hypothetical protein
MAELVTDANGVTLALLKVRGRDSKREFFGDYSPRPLPQEGE